MKRRHHITVLRLGALVAAAALLSGFHYTSQFSDNPFQKIYGAGGNYYTGSPRSLGMDCTQCHMGSEQFSAPEKLSLVATVQRVEGGNLVDDDIFANGYQPGQQYKFNVRWVGEHLGKTMTDGSYPNPNGALYKLDCPDIYFAGNRDHFTAEVMNENEVYATFNGTAAGQLRPDSGGSPTATGSCRNGSSWCGGGQYSDTPNATENGGPSTAMYKNWRLTDPNSNPPFGQWSCVQDCDAIVSNNWTIAWQDSQLAPVERVHSFFWTAPSPAPSAGGGRIRFYMAAVDSDGYHDALDDDVALLKRAVCPAGSTIAQCDPVLGPGWD